VEASRVFAGLLLTTKPTDEARLNLAYLRALGRLPKPAERQSLLSFLAKAKAEYTTRPEDATKLLKVGIAPTPKDANPIELAAWANVCRVLLNLQETITRY
jgi:hypothetical protein